MGLSTSSKAATAAATGILAIGIAVIAGGAAEDDLSDSICGACLVMIALSTGICVLVRHWVVATGEERRVLAAALRQTQAERTRYIAAQAGLENERSRLSRDMAAERARITATLAAAREQMETAFEEQRAQLAAEAFRTGVEMERAGMLKPGRQPVRNNLIHFPDRTPERARSREHGDAVP